VTERICERCGAWRCPRCRQWNDDLPPTIESGSVTFCSSCSQLVVSEDGGVRLPTPDEWNAVRNNAELWEEITYERLNLRRRR
jgi:hypothetical protein